MSGIRRLLTGGFVLAWPCTVGSRAPADHRDRVPAWAPGRRASGAGAPVASFYRARLRKLVVCLRGPRREASDSLPVPGGGGRGGPVPARGSAGAAGVGGAGRGTSGRGATGGGV